MTSDTKLQQLYDNFLEFTDHMVGQYGPYEVAGVMLAQALSIYKSSMNETEFDMMVDTISASRSKVQTFERTVLQ
jgi:hypothetical protein